MKNIIIKKFFEEFKTIFEYRWIEEYKDNQSLSLKDLKNYYGSYRE